MVIKFTKSRKLPRHRFYILDGNGVIIAAAAGGAVLLCIAAVVCCVCARRGCCAAQAKHGGPETAPTQRAQAEGEDLFRLQALPVGGAEEDGKKTKLTRHSKHAISLRSADTGDAFLQHMQCAHVCTRTRTEGSTLRPCSDAHA